MTEHLLRNLKVIGLHLSLNNIYYWLQLCLHNQIMHLDLFSNLTIVLILQLKCIMNVEQRWYLVCIQCKL